MSSHKQNGAPVYAVLLAAYACEPGLGSEAAVGWEWATNLARAGCKVHVLTRASNRVRIESADVAATGPNLSFTYFDLPRWARFWKRGNRGVHLYYLIWQLGAYFVARRLVKGRRFDLVHHVTYVTARFPSFMGLLGLPFVFGPLAGGEYAPGALWRKLGISAVFKESLRAASMTWWRFSPLLNLGFWSADRIFVTSAETLQRISQHAQKKAEIMLGIGSEMTFTALPSRATSSSRFEILFAGRFLYWKGMDYGLEAVRRLIADWPDVHLTMVGDGPCMPRWREKARELGLTDKVSWKASVPRAEFLQQLGTYDVLLFPSLHDSGGMVVLEAMTAGLPVVCLDFGGPGVVVDNTCGFKVRANTPEAAVSGLNDALRALISDRSLGPALGQAGRQRALDTFSWQGRVQRMLRCYEEVICKK